MITKAGNNHIHIIVDLLNQSYRSGQGWTTEKGLVSGARATSAMINSEMQSGYTYYLFSQQEDYVGCFNLYQQQRGIEIGGLAIKAELQRSGLGKLLLSHAESIAVTELNTDTTIVSVLEPRKELIQFYERRGYHNTPITYPFPVHRGAGTPLVENLFVVVLEKPHTKPHQ